MKNETDLLRDRDEDLLERFRLSGERLEQIAKGEASGMEENFRQYFRKTALLLTDCRRLEQKIGEGEFSAMTLEELQAENTGYFREILPENYEESYANPDYAERLLGRELGKSLCFLYTELREERFFAFEQDRFKQLILDELFLEVYGMFAGGKVTLRQLKDTIYWFLYDYAEEWCTGRIQKMLDPGVSFAADIVMGADLSDLRYLYLYGEYISGDEIRTAGYLNSLPQEEIEGIARTFTEGYREGFRLKGVDLSEKDTVDIQYPIGFERVIRAAVHQFREAGLESILHRSPSDTLNKQYNRKNGYSSSSPNEQFEYDHRFDQALYLDKRMVDRKIECSRKGYEKYREEAAGYSGAALFDLFGKDPFSPVRKESACLLSQRQQNLTLEYAALANGLMNEFINREERSFTIIAYPTPAIGDRFEEIFREVEMVNNLDNGKYQLIQQRIIDVLDRADSVQIMGREGNMTNLTVSLQELEDISRQTRFANCTADINIPLGEVYTSPKLEKTSGLLHVLEVYLEGICYKNLKLWIEDGMITDWSCDNFPSPEEGKALIRENILYNRDTLPMGEFAIGTNTTAFVMAEKYGIFDKLPILIAEKMGPHMAFGDTCYRYSEDVPVRNPDGREVVAKENAISCQRHESPMKAYFNCHTDITIPYGEIGQISAVMPDHYQVPIIIDGRFVLEGTLELNEPFSRETPGELSSPSGMEDLIEELAKKAEGSD